jgi:hypothetical protein
MILTKENKTLYNIKKRIYMETVDFEEIRNLIIELNLSKSIIDLYDGNCKIKNLQNDFEAPYAILDSNSNVQKRYLVNKYKPLLAYTFSTIYAYDINSKKYIKYNIELFNETKIVLMSWDSLFIRNIWNWWEMEISNETILEYGKILGLKYTEEIIENREQYSTLNYSEYYKKENDLIKIINNKFI